MISSHLLIEWLNANPADAPLVMELEEQAVAYVQRATGRYFGPLGVVTEVLRGSGTGRLWLSESPLKTGDPAGYVITVEEAYRPGDEPALLDADDYAVRASAFEGWLERRGGRTWRAGSEYHITYTRGYEEGGEPADIRRYVMAWVARQWSMRGKEGLQSEQIGGYSYTLSKMSDAEAESIIAQWRRPVIA
jgi:hypothetical protein